MRNASRRKPFHRHLLIASIAALIAVPAAFAHNHRSDSHRVAAHSGYGRHHSKSDRMGDVRYARSQDSGSQSVAALSGQRKHERVADEEELEQAEQ
jgi:hypothetical protein